MKLMAKGFSTNGQAALKGVIVAYEDDGQPMGAEWACNLSDAKDRDKVLAAIQAECLVDVEEARAAVRSVLKELQQAREIEKAWIKAEFAPFLRHISDCIEDGNRVR